MRRFMLAAVVAAWLALDVDPPVWVYVAVLVPLVVLPAERPSM